MAARILFAFVPAVFLSSIAFGVAMLLGCAVGAVSREVRAEGHLGAGLRAERGAACAEAPPIPGDGCEG